MKLLTLAILLMTLTGCAQIYWEKPGVSDQEYSQDVYECERERRQSYFDEEEGYYAKQRFEEMCMRSRGYHKIER